MMDNSSNGEAHVKILTDVCQNICSFIQTITGDNNLKNEKINYFELKIDDLQSLYLDVKSKFEYITELVKTLAGLLNFSIIENESSADLLNRWISLLSKKDIECTKKRKLYSPLKLSLKGKTEVNEPTKINMKSIQLVEENKKYLFSLNNQSSFPDEFKKVWKLNIKRNGNPSDLLKKSKQTTLNFQFKEEKVKSDVTTFSNSTSKLSSSDSSIIFSPMIMNAEKINLSQNNCENNTQINNSLNTTVFDSINMSISNFNKIIKPKKDKSSSTVITNTTNTSLKDSIEKKKKLSDETTINCSTNDSKNITKDTISSKKKLQFLDDNLEDSFDIIPGLNDKKKKLPDYNFKETPVRKRNERKLLNGWDCEDCCKFYEANNDNPIEAKTAMNHFSRHRSIKHQHIDHTPPGFWNPT